MLSDLRFALRLIVRAPGWSVVVVLSLALGIGANAAVFSLVDAVLLKPFPYRDAERLVLLWGSKTESTTRGISGADLADWRTQNHTFEGMDAFLLQSDSFSLAPDGNDKVTGGCIGADVLPLLGVRPLLGRNFSAEEARFGAGGVVIISHALWRTQFASDPGIVGRSIRLNDNPYEVIGVTPPDFFFPDTDPRLWVPSPCGVPNFEQRGAVLLHAVGRLKPGISVEQAQADLDTINARLALTFPATNRGTTAGIFPLRHVVIGEYERALWILLGAVVLTLLIACANVAHLQLVRGMDREGELAVRSASGASRSRLLRQLITETLVLGAGAGILGVFLAWAGVRLLHTLALTDIPRIQNAHIDWRVVGFAATISMIAGLLCGLWPAIKASRVDISEALKTGRGTTTGKGRGQLRDLLGIAEVAIAITLLVVAGLLVRSFVELSRAEWGFSPDGLLMLAVTVPDEIRREPRLANEFGESVVARLQKIAGVDRVARSESVPIRWSSWKPQAIGVDGHLVQDFRAGLWKIGHGYFQTAGIPILEGREFNETDTQSAPPRVVVSRTLAGRVWPGQSAVGKRLQLLDLAISSGTTKAEAAALIKRAQSGDASAFQPIDGLDWEVVGVVGDVRMFSLSVDGNPALYYEYRQVPRSLMGGTLPTPKFLLHTNGEPSSVIDSAKAAVLSVNAGTRFDEIAPLADLVARSIGGRGSNKLLLVVSTLFGTLALTFAVVGIYGVISHSVRGRLREIGIRIALGAGRGDVARIVIGQGVRLLVVGSALGLTMTWAVTRSLKSLLFGITVSDLPTYLLAAAILTVAVLLACALPLRRALRFEPVTLFKS